MPDLLSHMAAGLCFGALSGRREHTPALVVGSCLPDIFGRIPNLVMSGIEGFGLVVPHEVMFGTSFLHLPVGLLLSCTVFALLAHESRRIGFWCLLMTGALGHLCLDGLQLHLGGGYHWLYPFSSWEWEAGVIGTEATALVAPALFVGSYAVWRLRHAGQPWHGTAPAA